ncbi:hypothetical protein Leryth_008968 [Lithospermum erythrorhizon]|nr:hypothetical protein Leryth_008968 [Lithospermum erythrorhizon]
MNQLKRAYSAKKDNTNVPSSIFLLTTFQEGYEQINKKKFRISKFAPNTQCNLLEYKRIS